jgi:polysaccharide biosynthesis protein PslH
MRILWLSHLIPYPPKGGVQQRSYNLMRELSRHHEVDVVAFYQAAHHKDAAALTQAVGHMSGFCRMLAVLSLQVDAGRWSKPLLALRALVGNTYTVRWTQSAVYVAAIQDALRDTRYDVVHFDTISLAPYAELPGPMQTLPRLMNHHNIESAMLLRRAELETTALRAWYYRQEGQRLARYEQQTAGRFAAHLVCSALDGARLAAQCTVPVRVEVIPNGVDTDYFRRDERLEPAAQDSLVFAGRLDWYPNASAMRWCLAEIWPRIKALRPQARMAIVGKNPGPLILEAARQDSALTVPGFVDDVRPWIQGAQVYLCPITDGGGTKLKILDALAMGCAIVAHPIACEGIDVTDGQDILLGSTTDELVAHCIRLFDDAPLRRRLSAAAIKLAESTYTFKSIGSKLAELCSNVALAADKTPE